MKWGLVVALLLAVPLVGLIVWAQCDYTGTARQALNEDPRFARVEVTAPYSWPDVLLLKGSTRTERDKWDARNAIWSWTGKSGRCQPKGIINWIWSDEYRDYQISRPMQILRPCKETGYEPPCSLNDP